MFEKTTLPLHAAPGESTQRLRNLTLDDIQTDAISQIAQKHFGQSIKWKPAVVDTIVTEELEPTHYSPQKIMLLEYNQYLEKYLWPHFDAEKANLNHVLSICLMVNEKFRQRVSPWDLFSDEPVKFAALFQRVLHLLVPPDADRLTLIQRRHLVVFIIHCFQSLENTLVRKECLKITPITLWNTIGASRREALLSEYMPLRKLWNKAKTNYDAAEDKAALDFDSTWLSVFIQNFIELLYTLPAKGQLDEPTLLYCERVVELLIDLETQLPTRRYVNTLLDDHQVVVCSRLAPCMARADTTLLQQLSDRLAFYAKFEINDQTGLALTDLEMTEAHCAQLIHLQHTAFKHFKDIFPELPLANLGSIESRADLLWHLEPVDAAHLARLADAVNIRSQPIVNVGLDTKQYLLECLVAKYEKRPSQVEKVNAMPLYPNEETLFSDTLIQSQFYTGDRPLALPKLNLQFLTLHDYLLRNLTLFRLESSYEIRQDLEDVIKRLAPRLTYPDMTTEFAGWARMGLPIEHVSVVDVAAPELGQTQPAHVKADITYLARYTDTIKREWDSLRRHDVLFLVTLQANENTVNPYQEGEDFRAHYGIKYVRGCEVLDVLGEDGRPIDEINKPTVEDRQQRWKGDRRTLRVLLDPSQYKADMDRLHHHAQEDVHDTFNVLVRRKPQENNFKAVLETIRDLMQSDVVVPDWLHKVFLGYGDPNSAHYRAMPNRLRELNFRDTFLNWEHVQSSFPGKTVRADPDAPINPPYVIQFQGEEPVKKKKSKKAAPPAEEQLVVSTYKVPNMGPYPQDIPKKNSVRFTPVQVEAIHSGINNGLTMVVGPPGTGKTDVTVQIIANLYHNNPNQHTLIVTHSNQALNQIFEKIMSLDIDPRHLVRLGHGQEELDTELSFSKYGRVSSFLERRLELLQNVTRLAASLGIPGDHGATCETASYFYQYYVLTLWEPYYAQAQQQEDATAIRTAFPFTHYFSDAPTPVFTEDMTPEAAREAARGCFRHLEKIFTELEEIRAFELLRHGSDRANYLVTKEAKIIAMTCTHAALKRRELVELGFRYDNVVMEEAAQILEVETFIPLVLQNENRLKRVVLVGDHHQLPPVVKNAAFQQYGNMEQSLFTRFVRLGTPVLQLDRQGRARPSLADLYAWQYKGLGHLPIVDTDLFKQANPGLTYDYQLIDVEAYQGKGETEPVPYFYQNVGEAEYAIALYQYMRLTGIPAKHISILTTYNGQRALLNDVLERRCAWNPYFGKPAVITTVDQYQGQQNDHVILSLVRTKAVGHIRDVRRLVVAMSRARLGLYIFGNKKLFENCYELKPVFDKLLQRPTKLCLHPNETYPTQRSVEDHSGSEEMQDVEEFGKIVYKLSQEQVASMEAEVAAQQAEQEGMDVDQT